MAINYNGILYTELPALEEAISDLSPEQQQFIINDFHGIPNPTMTSFELQQKIQREWGMPYIQGVVDTLGARNLLLSSQGVPVNTALLLQQLGAIKELADTGSLKTARGVVQQVKASGAFPIYEDIFDTVIADITNFLVTKGFE